MPNPFWDETLRGYTGRDKPVVDFFARFQEMVEPFLDAAERLVRQSIAEYLKDGRDHLQVAFGCTGGQHRSVYFAERMAARLSGIDGVEIEVAHTAMPYWKTIHLRENRDGISQETSCDGAVRWKWGSRSRRPMTLCLRIFLCRRR